MHYSWSVENFGVSTWKNNLLWLDMERAYEYVELHAKYSISGSLEGFLFELFRRRWNLACANIIEDPPEVDGNYGSTNINNFISQTPNDLRIASLDRIPLDDNYVASFKEYASRVAPDEEINGGRLYGYGTDGYGTYIHLHLLWPSRKDYWGIYISETGVLNLAAKIYRDLRLERKENSGKAENEQNRRLIQISYQIILRHQLFHFKVEHWTLFLILSSGRPYYLSYLEYVYLPSVYDSNDNNLEEALANLSILLSKKIKKIQNEGGLWGFESIIRHFLNSQGPSYRNYKLLNGIPNNLKNSDRTLHDRGVVNYLCNQIVQQDLRPSQLIPCYLYPPNNNFLRAENLCPIFLIANLPSHRNVIS